ncbi:hypothetical protein [Luteimonas arsenica]|uniref:hypothetical protein n=1 Tax=Luteimonas arsenica TaxID=1586242 RepID=UPI00105508A2|nr:hypothetical protein [Luteimonas arsenica]
MEAFLTTSLDFPTLVYSVLLGVCVVYWLLAATGLVEIDGLDLDLDAEPDGIAGILGRLGLNGVPLMLVLTLVVFFAWVATYFVHLLVLAHVPGPLRWLLGAGVALLALPPAILATAAALRPLRRRLLLLRPPTGVSLLGRVAVVRTPDIDESHGMADLDDGGAGLVLQVRGDPAAGMKRGDRVVLVAHALDSNTWNVVPERDYEHL